MIKYSKKILKFLNSITNQRPRIVIQHILKHGYITSEELKNKYEYNHPPRAIRDVRELGIPIVTTMIKGTDGRYIGKYEFGDLNNINIKISKAHGRSAFSKKLKDALVKTYGPICFIYNEKMDESCLQVDHRIPYEIGGECSKSNIDNFMLLSPSANRAKSWTCEHCNNWTQKKPEFCLKCFWAHPEDYDHVAGKKIKLVSIMFSGDEVADYNKLISISNNNPVQKTIKQIIHEHLE